ncbi:MAG TPA: amino acid adenylation domain-containing protein, partial [Terriglobia bacterium]|nr:amino acid adenylation domain-containing protein [Terriglobia bacterium]
MKVQCEHPAIGPMELPVFRLVEKQAAAQPNALAVSSKDGDLTYRELDERASHLCSRLRQLGVRSDVPVALYIRSSLEMVVGALGILKAGGAYLPLDPDYPAARVSMILNDAKVPIVITRNGENKDVPEGSWDTVDIDLQLPSPVLNSRFRTESECAPGDLSYIIYTSGSTGQPKGVQISHASLSNLAAWHCSDFAVTSSDRATQIAGVGFDAAVWELWPYLASGASIHIPDDWTRTEPVLLRNWLLSRRITICFLPTVLAERIITLDWPADASLRLILTGADVLTHYPRPNLPFKLVNNYGPTECTVVATSGIVPPSENSSRAPSIGRPIRNTNVYILNEELKDVPPGTPGQLYIGGAGVARGYVHQPELTATRFVPDPFRAEPGARMFATGDLCSFLPDGQLAFLGRIDDQIKIRGYRVEPNEIVSNLIQCPGVEEAAVAARKSSTEDTQLVAYFVAAPHSSVTYSSMHEFLRARLPDYMVPGVFISLKRLPLTQNGKVDRAALPEPNPENVLKDESSEVPQSPVEKQLSDILISLL